MAAPGRTIIIAGAGIAGLTLALALAKFGASVQVLERNAELSEFGAGLQLGPNARRVLNQLGLDKALAAVAFAPEGIDVVPFNAEQPLLRLALGEAARKRYGVPYAVMHRADLVEALHRATRRFANIDIAFGVEKLAVETAHGGVVVSHEGGGTAACITRGHAFIGADGVHSPTRSRFVGGGAARYAGYVTWRALLPEAAARDLVSLDAATLLLGPGFHAVAYPLPHRGAVNVALFTPATAPAGDGDGPPALRLPRGNARLSSLIAAAPLWTPWPLYTVEVSAWHRGPIGLVGDAAHAMLPFQAQGAAMAIEDAAILAPLLVTEPTASAALTRFAAMRHERIDKVARISAANGRVFHLRWPLSVARDAAISARGAQGHFRRLDWLYGYDAAPEVENGGPKRPS